MTDWWSAAKGNGGFLLRPMAYFSARFESIIVNRITSRAKSILSDWANGIRRRLRRVLASFQTPTHG